MVRFLAAGLLVCVAAQAQAQTKTYENTFTPAARQAYSEDINVWAYTSAFAKRFGMPEQWIDDGLKGAYAVAFRVETSSARTMFPHKGPDVSKVRKRCVLDVYIPATADIPWVDDHIADKWWYTPDSPTYLMPQSREDREWRGRPVGLPHWNDVVSYGTGAQSLGGLPIREYRKSLYPGVTYISFNKGCVTPPRDGAWITFNNYRRRSDSEPRWSLVRGRVAHRIDIPATFMQRLYDEWLRKSRRPAQEQWREILKR